MLLDWLSSVNYPCMFGRKAAKAGLVSVLVLEERDLTKRDEDIEGLIRDARIVWREEARRGRKHARLSSSQYRRDWRTLYQTQRFSSSLRRLCEMYLGQTVRHDVVYRDELFLEINADSPLRIRWEVGVDNFAAQGDGRWWHDHRIPGGVAFSMNSVGHMVRSMVERAGEARPDLKATWIRDKLIQFALPMAMRTILFAQEKSRCPGTRLRPRLPGASSTISDEEVSRSQAMKGVLDWDESAYEGWYHTDHSLRADFFDPHSVRPSQPWELDFKYLHAQTELDYRAMSIGEEILGILGMN